MIALVFHAFPGFGLERIAGLTPSELVPWFERALTALEYR